MKQFILYLLISLLFPVLTEGQEAVIMQPAIRKSPRFSRGERSNVEKTDTNSVASVRMQRFYDGQALHSSHACWEYILYRQVDLAQEENIPLYNFVRTAYGKENLFSILFRLLREDKLPAFEYLGGHEDFSTDFPISFQNISKRFHLSGDDIPATDIKSYYVKEAWYFDPDNSMFNVEILAICPILTSYDEIGKSTMPVCWIIYKDLFPYINTVYIQTSAANRSVTYTIDDYFRCRMYKGEIVRTEGGKSLPLKAYCQTPDSLRKEQEAIQCRLTGFEKSLWVQSDTLFYFYKKGK